MGKFRKILPLLALPILLALPHRASAQSLELNLFPEMPIYRSVMVDPDIPKTEIRTPGNLADLISTTPWNSLYPNTTLAKTLPLVSLDLINPNALSLIPKTVVANADLESLRKREKLSQTALSLSLIASGQTGFPDKDAADYRGRLELFLTSPMANELSDGNRLYIVGGLEKNGSIKLNSLNDATVPQVFEKLYSGFESDTNLFADIYIVPKSPYSDQYLILRAGFGNLLDKDNAYFHASTTWEFPSIFSDDSSLKILNVSPYVSVYMGALLKNFQTNGNQTQARQYGLSAQAGIKIYGKSGASVILYEEMSSSTNQQPLIFLSGLKIDM